MDKAVNASLFVNDGSFLERFKQLQQDKENKNEIPNKSKEVSSTLLNAAPKTVIGKTAMELKSNCIQKTIRTPSSGKLAFSFKQKAKLVAPAVKLGEDENEDDVTNHSDDVPMKRQKLGQPDKPFGSPKLVNFAPPFPSDPTVRKVADKLASFVAKNGRQFEHVTRQKNPGDTPFKFLFDESCSDFKYYEYRLREEQMTLSETRDSQSSPSVGSVGNVGTATPSTTSSFQASYQQHSKYQTPSSALYKATESAGSARASLQTSERYGESNTPTGSDPIAMMEYYMKKAAAEEKRRPPKASKDEMPPPASLQAPVEKGHHMGDFIPPEELEKFFATCNDASAQKAWKEMADKTKIQADNVGHKLLSKMGWREGQGLGSSKSGISAPIMAGEVKKDHLGVGAHAPGEVTPDDDIYEQYKKRMMLGYRHRPNPLNNPRKSYY